MRKIGPGHDDARSVAHAILTSGDCGKDIQYRNLHLKKKTPARARARARIRLALFCYIRSRRLRRAVSYGEDDDSLAANDIPPYDP